jgi:hypothetical protein
MVGGLKDQWSKGATEIFKNHSVKASLKINWQWAIGKIDKDQIFSAKATIQINWQLAIGNRQNRLIPNLFTEGVMKNHCRKKLFEPTDSATPKSPKGDLFTP